MYAILQRQACGLVGPWRKNWTKSSWTSHPGWASCSCECNHLKRLEKVYIKKSLECWQKPSKTPMSFSSNPTCLPRGLPRCFRDHSFSFRGWLVSWFCFRGASAKTSSLWRLVKTVFRGPSAIGRSASASASASHASVAVGFTSAGPT